MSNGFDGKRFLIIGGGGGIGTQLCRRLHEQGAELVIASRDMEHLRPVADETGARAETLDAREPAAVEELVSELASNGVLHGAVNLAGSVLIKPAHTMKENEFEETLGLNLITAFNVVRACAKAMIKQDDGGSVVLMSSAVARHGFPAHEAIAAAKAGVEGLMRSAAAGYANKSVRVNCVAPGLVRTPLSAPVFNSDPMLKASLAMHADGKPCEPEQAASAIAFLLHPDQAHVTGQTLGVDGGLGSLHAK